MGEFLKEFGQLVKSKVKEDTSGQMVKFMKGISKMMFAMEQESFSILMEKDLKEHGGKETNTEEERISFQMDLCTKQSTKTERNQETVN